MRKPDHVIEIFLQPGDVYFGDRDTRIRTLLGSCVSLVLWHPQLLVGGMCHYMLPAAGRARSAGHRLDGRYAEEAIAMLLRDVEETGAPLGEYQAKLFGGADMFPHAPKLASAHVGARNVEAAQKLVEKHGLNCVVQHLGGAGHRNLIFDVWSGRVLMKHDDMAIRAAPPPLPGWAGEKNCSGRRALHHACRDFDRNSPGCLACVR